MTDERDESSDRPRTSADLVRARSADAESSGQTQVVSRPSRPVDPAAGASVFDDVDEPSAVYPGAVSSVPTIDAPVEAELLPPDDKQWVRYRRSFGPLVRLGIVAFVVLAMFFVGWRWLHNWVDAQITPSGPPGDTVEFTIEEGATTNAVASALGDAGVIENSAMFRQWLRCPSALRWLLDCPGGIEYEFRAGDYVLQENLTYEAVLDLLAEGPLPEEVIRVTIPEGLTLDQMRDRLLSDLELFDAAELDAALVSESAVWEHYPADYLNFGIINLEGLFFPDTYQLSVESRGNELALLQRMQDQFETVVDDLEIETKAAALGYTPYDIVIIASMIEEEARVDEDRARIARVIYNRLASDPPLLGIDATTRYAFNVPNGVPLTTEQINDASSPYNTRAVPGLPPTPIAAPGRASLEAALNPEPGDWFYYVLTSEDGSHTFSVTSAEHEAAVQICIERDLGCG